MKTVLITGGQGDLARGMIPEFAREGWTVLAPGRSELDVSSDASVENYFKTVSRLDGLIHAAGGVQDQILSKMSESQWNDVVNSHLSGAWRCAKAAIPFFEKSGGHLLWVGSYRGVTGAVGQSNYAAAKAGLIGLSQSLARECGARNIRSNVILPGYLPTRMNQHLTSVQVEAVQEEHVLRRFNTIAEAARWAAFLLSTEHVSGQVFQLDSRVRRWA